MPRWLTPLIAILSLLPATAVALECAPPPRAVAKTEAAKLDASGEALLEALGGDRFAEAQIQAEAAFRRDHDEDSLVAKLMLVHAACTRLSADGTLSESVKRERLLEVERSFEYRDPRATRVRSRGHPAAIDRDDAFSEAILLVRTASGGRTSAHSVRAGARVDGASVTVTPALRRRTVAGDLEELRLPFSPPLPVTHCRDLSLEVRTEGAQGDEWRFHLAGAILKTRKGQEIFDLFEPVAPVELDAANTTRYLDPRLEACSRRSL
jgi:hypothetical protein